MLCAVSKRVVDTIVHRLFDNYDISTTVVVVQLQGEMGI